MGMGVRVLVRVLLLLLFLVLPVAIMEGGRVVCVVNLPLVTRGRYVSRVVHIVGSCSIIVRQRVFSAWIPPERAALNGRWPVYGNNGREWRPCGRLLRWRRGDAKM